MSERDDQFGKFPSTAHLAWLGKTPVRGDKVLNEGERSCFLSSTIIAEEKIDGANLGISVDPDGQLRFQNRGNYLQGSLTGQWKPLRGWAAAHTSAFLEHLAPGLILFGEWCYATHSLAYSRLPDWFLTFDVFDTHNRRFWSTRRRNDLTSALGLTVVPKVYEGRATLILLTELLSQKSAFADATREGLYLRRENDDFLEARAKLVNPAFTQAIGEHWSRGALQTNRLATGDPFRP